MSYLINENEKTKPILKYIHRLIDNYQKSEVFIINDAYCTLIENSFQKRAQKELNGFEYEHKQHVITIKPLRAARAHVSKWEGIE